MAILRNKRKLGAAWRKTPENTVNNQSQNTLSPPVAGEYNTYVSEEKKESVTEKQTEKFSLTASRILGALSKLDEFLLNPQVRTCSLAVPGTSRNINSENMEPTWDHYLNDPCPEVVFSACAFSNLNDSE